MFSHVQFSMRVILDSLFCYPITFSVNHAAIFVWIFSRDSHDFLHSHFHLCLSQHHYLIALHQPPAEMLQPGHCPSSHFSEDSGVLTSSFWPLCSPDSHISTYAFWHDPLLPVGRHHHWLFDLTSGRLTVPSEPSSIANTAMHPHHWPSCILRAPQPVRDTCLSITNNAIPFHYLRRLFSPDFYGASHLKSPSAITASSTTSRRPRVHPAPHHRLLVSALFAASFASSRPTLVFHPPR